MYMYIYVCIIHVSLFVFDLNFFVTSIINMISDYNSNAIQSIELFN